MPSLENLNLVGFGPATVISMLPYDLHEDKPLYPASFFMPAAKKGDFELMAIQTAERPYYVDFDRGTLRIPESPEVVAASVVNDHIRASVSSSTDAHPGLMWVKGAYFRDQKKEVMTRFEKELRITTEAQIKWFQKLVKAADDAWQRFRQNRMISDNHIRAANYLGVKREWADTPDPSLTTECKYCTSLISTRARICPICRMPLDETLAKNFAMLPDAVKTALMGASGKTA